MQLLCIDNALVKLLIVACIASNLGDTGFSSYYTQWTQWSRCYAECGSSYSKRSRDYLGNYSTELNEISSKKCVVQGVILEEVRGCINTLCSGKKWFKCLSSLHRRFI